MKLPRWLVIAMLITSVLSVLAAAGWWWVTWPERTAQSFVSLVEDEEFELANAMLARPADFEFIIEGDLIFIRDTDGNGMGAGPNIIVQCFRKPKPQKRTFADLLLGRMTFELPFRLRVWRVGIPQSSNPEAPPFLFKVERNHAVLTPG